jgi:hypothetical protein
MPNPPRKPTAEVEYTKLLLGHRTSVTSHTDGDYSVEMHRYATQAVPLTRPERRAKDSVQCASCGKTVRVKLWARASRRMAVRRWWWWAFGAATVADWTVFWMAIAGEGGLGSTVAALTSGLWFAAMWVVVPFAVNAEALDDDCWVKVVRGHGAHRMLRPGHTTIERRYSNRMPDV